MAENAPKKVLLMMGCPEVPVQMSIVLYLSHKLTKAGLDVTVAGTDAANKLLKVSDFDGYYVKNSVDLDQCIVDIIEKRTDFDICFAFMHSDAGMAFAATMSAISKAKLYAVVFGRNAEALAETIEFNSEKIVAKAVHNPNPLKNKIDKVIAGLVS
ncbi:MAG: DUF1890 domain-containing protein [Methanotrichaceae archaeon]|jgi:hypothetical protein